MDRIKAISLLSGGLDSLLVVKILQEQGIEVEALHLVSAFGSRCDGKSTCRVVRMQRTAEMLGIKVHILDRDAQLLELVKNPKYGHGSNLNPCIDCRIQMLIIAKEVMQEAGAQFLASGEVMGQRPMSQRKQAMELVEKEAGMEGLLIRPLSAQFLEPTIPEQKGWIDRDALPAISGRSRKPQMQLAEKYGITEYPSPAGGCLLTDPHYSHRLQELLDYKPTADMNDARLLKCGRHFRLDATTKAIVGRDQYDNQRLAVLRQEGDLLMDPADITGPRALLRGDTSENNARFTASLIGYYSKARNSGSIRVSVERNGHTRIVEAAPADRSTVDNAIIQLN